MMHYGDSYDSDDEAVEDKLLDLNKEQNYEEKATTMRKLLDSRSSLFSRKMRDWLLKPDVCEILLNFVVRPKDAAALIGDKAAVAAPSVTSNGQALDSDEYIFSSTRRREALLKPANAEQEEQKKEAGEEDTDEDDDELLNEEGFAFSKEAKRADKAAEIFVYQVSAFPHSFFEANLAKLVKTIFKIFDVDSLGDFDNFDKIFQCLWTSRSTSLISIFSQNAKLFLGMLNYLHNQAVAETLLSMMKPNLQEQILINFYNTLNANGFFQLLGEKMYGKGAESSYEDASAFFIRLVESCCSFRNADVLFMDIGRNQSLVEGLLHAMTNQCEYPVSHDQQIACMYALRMLLIKSGEKLFDQSLEAYTPVPLPNMLTCVRNDLLNLLKSKAALLGDRLLVEDGIYTGSQLKNKDSAVSKQKESGEFKYSSFVIKKPFGLHRIALLEIIAELVEEVPIETLDGFDPQVWRVLSVWLFEHKFNNVYHALFYRLFKTVVKHNHVPSLKALLSRSKFLTKMISHYTSHTMFESGLRSYILFFSNYLRLMADIQPPSEYLKNFLNSHQPWKEYLPILIKETKRQMITDFPAPSPSGPIHPFLLQDSFGMYGQSAKLNPITEDDVDIDLGSSYADKLGFEGKTAFEEPLKTKKNRKRRTRRKSQQVSTSRENGGDKKVSSSNVPAMNGSKASSSSNSASDDDDSDSFDSDLDSEDEEVNAAERKEAQPKEVTAN